VDEHCDEQLQEEETRHQEAQRLARHAKEQSRCYAEPSSDRASGSGDPPACCLQKQADTIAVSQQSQRGRTREERTCVDRKHAVGARAAARGQGVRTSQSEAAAGGFRPVLWREVLCKHNARSTQGRVSRRAEQGKKGEQVAERRSRTDQNADPGQHARHRRNHEVGRLHEVHCNETAAQSRQSHSGMPSTEKQGTHRRS
jgi:hypothetical protein